MNYDIEIIGENMEKIDLEKLNRWVSKNRGEYLGFYDGFKIYVVLWDDIPDFIQFDRELREYIALLLKLSVN